MQRQHSLTALRAFEAVGRLRSISAAAEELRVTRPAVSKQVTQLEASMGTALLIRHGNAIALTKAGEDLCLGLRRAFEMMTSTVEAVSRRGSESSRLRILVCRDFAASWLASRVGAFLVDNPGISVEITADRNGNFRPHEEFDLCIFYGTESQKVDGFEATELCRWIDMPVCTKSFAMRHLGDGRRPGDAPYLIDANYDIWDEWCVLTGFKGSTKRRHATTFNETTLCLSVAISGGGLTIGDSFLTLGAIASGALIVPYPVGLESAQAYYLFAPSWRNASTVARRFESWLKNEVQAYQASVLRELELRSIRIVSRGSSPRVSSP